MKFCFHLVLGAGLGVAAGYAASAPDTERTVRTVVRADASGRLVRSTVVTPRVVHETVIAARPVAQDTEDAPDAVAQKAPPSTFRDAVDQIAERHKLPPLLVHSVIKVESNYNPNAVSSKGALGLMQLVPSTARRFGVSNSFDPSQNVDAGVRYLRYLQDLFGDDRLAIAAYNAGEGAVLKRGGIPPFRETRNY